MLQRPSVHLVYVSVIENGLHYHQPDSMLNCTQASRQVMGYSPNEKKSIYPVSSQRKVIVSASAIIIAVLVHRHI